MKLILGIGVLVIVFVLMAALTKGKEGSGEGKWPFHARAVLTDVEQILYWRLLRVFPDHMVLAQVALSSLISVNKGVNSKAWQNRIAQKSADFVLCSRDARIVAVIELDDSTHQRTSRRKADEVKDKALAAAGIRVVRWQAVALPNETAIREMIQPTTSKATPLPSFNATR